MRKKEFACLIIASIFLYYAGLRVLYENLPLGKNMVGSQGMIIAALGLIICTVAFDILILRTTNEGKDPEKKNQNYG